MDEILLDMGFTKEAVATALQNSDDPSLALDYLLAQQAAGYIVTVAAQQEQLAEQQRQAASAAAPTQQQPQQQQRAARPTDSREQEALKQKHLKEMSIRAEQRRYTFGRLWRVYAELSALPPLFAQQRSFAEQTSQLSIRSECSSVIARPSQAASHCSKSDSADDGSASRYRSICINRDQQQRRRRDARHVERDRRLRYADICRQSKTSDSDARSKCVVGRRRWPAAHLPAGQQRVGARRRTVDQSATATATAHETTQQAGSAGGVIAIDCTLYVARRRVCSHRARQIAAACSPVASVIVVAGRQFVASIARSRTQTVAAGNEVAARCSLIARRRQTLGLSRRRRNAVTTRQQRSHTRQHHRYHRQCDLLCLQQGQHVQKRHRSRHDHVCQLRMLGAAAERRQG
jgi:hypothetical protein